LRRWAAPHSVAFQLRNTEVLPNVEEEIYPKKLLNASAPTAPYINSLKNKKMILLLILFSLLSNQVEGRKLTMTMKILMHYSTQH
jgi:hypothetical protein